MLKTTGKLPTQVIEVTYDTDHGSRVKRQVFLYPGEDPDVVLSNAWTKRAIEAVSFKINYSAEQQLVPSEKAGVWV